ncbi:hypothetical protein HPP92_021919 [Vanilla planifolia]|uniref:Rho-GAP domain-containing protein n=1 Tax=Vanilla planifolia TaxID=51239 RepID=A0A835PUR8_VANPL|nr:hypothetical protein HPP92_021919 [Vanilla planifolia]
MADGSPAYRSRQLFDRFDGFLGLPVEFLPEISNKVPALGNFIGVITLTDKEILMVCSTVQKLYNAQKSRSGIFRINAENGQELLVREQLNKGIVPHGVDLHCLAGLIKAWFRELPNGVLDSIAPDKLCTATLKKSALNLRVLPPTEAALLNWAVNLMADVVEYEHINKMNARNIAMVFAPNMTQMANPLTALIHAVQVMNFLKTLILTTLRERLSAAAEARQLHSYCGSHRDGDSPDGFEHAGHSFLDVDKENSTIGASYVTSSGNLFSTLDSDSDAEESFQSFEKRTETDDF